MNKNFKRFENSILVWFVAAALLMVVYGIFSGVGSTSRKLMFSDFLSNLEAGNVNEVVMRGNTVEGKLVNGDLFTTLIPNFYPQLIDQLKSKHVKMEIVPIETSLGAFGNVLLSWFPVLLLAGVWIYFMRSMQGGNRAMGFGKSKARLVYSNNKVTFSDVAGIEEAKDELIEIVEFLKDPGKFQKLGGEIPRGCLLVGSPGTGKTLLARAIAGEAGVPFFTISGSDFVEMFVGVGASRVRDMFSQAKKSVPCIIFIDEIDAVGRHRGAGLGGGNDEREQTLNQLLVEMDGFAKNEGVIVIAATNRPDVLDPALLRPGRFDRQITIPVPDISGREQILLVHIKKVPVTKDVNIKILARGTPGFVGADLANLVNEAALMAARRNNKAVNMAMFEEAKDKVMMGRERRSMIMTEEEKRLTAYHEAGHTLVAAQIPASDPLHKVTIIPRGRALGLSMHLPEKDKYSYTAEWLNARLAIGLGGRAAEELVFGKTKITTGAGNDIQYVTHLARKMVMQWGLSEEIGPMFVGGEKEEVFLGYSMGKESHISESMSKRIDNEVKKMVESKYELSKSILNTNIEALHLLAKMLLEYETLSGQDVKILLEEGEHPFRKMRAQQIETLEESDSPPSVPIYRSDKKNENNTTTIIGAA